KLTARGGCRRRSREDDPPLGRNGGIRSRWLGLHPAEKLLRPPAQPAPPPPKRAGIRCQRAYEDRCSTKPETQHVLSKFRALAEGVSLLPARLRLLACRQAVSYRTRPFPGQQRLRLRRFSIFLRDVPF